MSQGTNASAGSNTSKVSWFATTHWDWLARTQSPHSPDAAGACEALCKIYWNPIYQFIRRFGQSPENAEDLTQGFILMLLEKNFWGRADRNKGRFRNLLLKALTQFLLDERDRANAMKRGRGVQFVSLDGENEAYPEVEIAHGNQTPEDLFNRSWALSLIDRARLRLRTECLASGKSLLCDCIDFFAENTASSKPYSEIARELGVSVSAVKSGISRLRTRFAELVREEVARTVKTREEVDEEIQFLLSRVAS